MPANKDDNIPNDVQNKMKMYYDTIHDTIFE